ncbi:hypothetical protein, partial [Staphylococcus sp. HMSC078B01]|uniref:hypothetical protein n=1 Tax=Staphylococcus sp. HMSC078B01 TaxID=1739506 RepID=UPI001C404669
IYKKILKSSGQFAPHKSRQEETRFTRFQNPGFQIIYIHFLKRSTAKKTTVHNTEKPKIIPQLIGSGDIKLYKIPKIKRIKKTPNAFSTFLNIN